MKTESQNSIPQIIKIGQKLVLLEINVRINKSVDNIRGFAWNESHRIWRLKGVPVYKEVVPVL